MVERKIDLKKMYSQNYLQKKVYNFMLNLYWHNLKYQANNLYQIM